MSKKQLMARLSALSNRAAAGTGLALLGVSGAQAAIDTAAITAAAADVALVGAAVFAVIIGVKVWKWIRSAA